MALGRIEALAAFFQINLSRARLIARTSIMGSGRRREPLFNAQCPMLILARTRGAQGLVQGPTTRNRASSTMNGRAPQSPRAHGVCAHICIPVPVLVLVRPCIERARARTVPALVLLLSSVPLPIPISIPLSISLLIPCPQPRARPLARRSRMRNAKRSRRLQVRAEVPLRPH